VLVHGAEPLFFLDYFALGKLDQDLGKRVLKGIAEGCRRAGAALVGGETAEMPGFYSPGDFDLAGFAVGAVERSSVLPRRNDIQAGDILLGVASSGVHSNGYSLVRRVVKDQGLLWSDPAPFCENKTLGEAFLIPTQIYVKSVLYALKNSQGIKALAHITGSGALGKLHRILPSPSKTGVKARINLDSWTVPSIFHWLRNSANLQNSLDGDIELLRAFNCGIGMVAVVAQNSVDEVQTLLESAGEKVFPIGEIISHSHEFDSWEDPEKAVDLKGRLVFQELPKARQRKFG
jgi:phosphoribosylformylglycinamidine cyclo-ligase